MIQGTYFIKLADGLAESEILYTNLPWVLLFVPFLLCLLVCLFYFYPSLAATDDVDNSSLPGTERIDHEPDNFDTSSIRDTHRIDNEAANFDTSSLPDTDRVDQDHLSEIEVLDNGDHSFLPGNRIDHVSEIEVHLNNGADDRSLPGIRIDDDPLRAMDEMNQGFLPTGDDDDPNEVVILLVGNKDADKRGVVKSLTRSGAWDDSKIAVDSSKKSCVRIVKSCTSPSRVIVNTTPLINIPRRSPTMIARRWVARNCLRRILSGKDVVVVLVVTCQVRNTCKWDVFSSSNCWVDVVCQIFKNHRGAIMILVNTEGQEDVPENIRSALAEFVLRHGLSPMNITYSNLKRGDDSVKTTIENSIHPKNQFRDRGSSHRLENATASDGRRPSRWKSCCGSCWQLKRGRPDTNYVHRTVMPFTVDVAAAERGMFGPWGPRRMILFGRTGSGKSTLAQMLTGGKLDKMHSTFPISSGVRGETKKVQPGVGRGWYVVDTPGVGESRMDSMSSLSTSTVENKIKRYVRMVEGTFSHYVYVWKKDRVDQLDEILWKFFLDLFGEEVKRQCTVVVSNADGEWVQDNIGYLKARFKGCESFLSAEFPAIAEEHQEFERACQKIRRDSLLELEENLASLNRYDRACKYGRLAKMSKRMETNLHYWDRGIEKKKITKCLVGGASMIFDCCNICKLPFSMCRKDSLTLMPR